MLRLKSFLGLLPRSSLARSPILPAPFCTEVPKNVQLDEHAKAAAPHKSCDSLLDSQKSKATQHNCPADVSTSHFISSETPPFKHQLVLCRLLAHISNDGYTGCLNVSVQYGLDDLRSHDMSVWAEDAGTICKNMVSGSDTRVDGYKAPPYLVIKLISSKSGQKHDLDIKHLCTVNGVEYLWLVHPDEGWIEVYALPQGKVLGKYSIQDHLIWPGCVHVVPPFSDLDVDLKEIFAHVDCEMLD